MPTLGLTADVLGEYEALARNARKLVDATSGANSAASSEPAEQREALQEAEGIQDQLERRSNASSYVGSAASSKGTSHIRRRDLYRLAEGGDAAASAGTSDSPSTALTSYRADVRDKSRGGPPVLNQVERAILEAKRQNLSARKFSSGDGSSGGDDNMSGSGSNLSRHTIKSGNGGGGGVSGAGSSKSAGSSRHASLVAGLLKSYSLDVMPEDQRQEVEAVMHKVVATTGAELADMQLALEQQRQVALKMEMEQADAKAELLKANARIVANENIFVNLTKTREQAWQAEKERDDLQDKLAGMEARLSVKMENHASTVADLQMQKCKAVEEAKMKAVEDLEDKQQLMQELATANADVEKAKKLKMVANMELDAVRHTESISSKALALEREVLHSELNAAELELERKTVELSEANRSPWDSFEAQRKLEQQLKEQRDSNHQINADLSELRIEMLKVHTAKEEELQDLKARVQIQQTSGAASRLQRRASMSKKGGFIPKNQLCSIDEDDVEDIASQAGSCISGQVSEGGDMSVADLADLDGYDDTEMFQVNEAMEQDVERLTDELADAQTWYKNLEDEKTSKDAEHTAKIDRLQKQMITFREEAIANQDEVERLKMVTEEIDAEKEAQVVQVKMQLAAAATSERASDLEDRVLILSSELEDVRQQLSFADESKLRMGVRLQDTQHELVINEQRHAKAIQDLRARLQIAGVDGDSGGIQKAESSVFFRLQTVEEDRNLLRNELECERVNYQAQLDSERQQLQLSQARLREEEAMAEKDRQLKNQVEESLHETQRLLAASRWALKEAEDRLAVQAERALQAAPEGPSLLSLLRCPSRSYSSTAHAAAGSGVPVAACQAIVWQIISAMSGVTALMCAQDTLMITEASKKAFTMWGSVALRGSSMCSLAFDQASATWMEDVLTSGKNPGFGAQNLTPGFWLRELGCIEFRSKLGSAFDSSVTCAGLPEEKGRPASIIVIIEPLEREEQQHRGGFNGLQAPPNVGRRHRYGAPSVASSVHSEDITANDSVSNVNGRW
mmetsp:Transcript_93260/g.301651  ORF Transcript_93260/g.301651 Transcript_93260/m.301651 type:complete len:1029 (-) Transcript_93260:164-3250(-)